MRELVMLAIRCRGDTEFSELSSFGDAGKNGFCSMMALVLGPSGSDFGVISFLISISSFGEAAISFLSESLRSSNSSSLVGVLLTIFRSDCSFMADAMAVCCRRLSSS